MDANESFVKHQRLYKGHVTPWKDVYRKRCRERLKKSRDTFLGRYRPSLATASDPSNDLVNSLMLEEWQTLHMEQAELPTLPNTSEELNFEKIGNENIDEVISVFEEIRAELIREERLILAEYEAGMNFDQASLSSTLDSVQTPQVICPLCQRNALSIDRGVIYCQCGARIDTEQDCVTLPYIQQNLHEGTCLHSQGCQHIPTFAVISQMGVDTLVMTCQACDFMYIVV
ncbi:hypothetical protein NP493_531g04054 [Ridgeia piscesae]|uniref:RPA-interacting protein n=1 Tax=Ridgeia piscesae TaxID=27915 RepID=A0AAD9KVY1_RIDPI|nr:hypothetical protein NP493_531g04054 [Ridgeia piscesae]